MVTAIWDEHGLTMFDYREKGKTIKGKYNFNYLDSFNHAVKKQRAQVAKKKIPFQQDNACTHLRRGHGKIPWDRIRVVSSSTIFARFSTKQFFQFPNMKNEFGETKKFALVKRLLQTNNYFEGL